MSSKTRLTLDSNCPVKQPSILTNLSNFSRPLITTFFPMVVSGCSSYGSNKSTTRTYVYTGVIHIFFLILIYIVKDIYATR